MALNHPRKHGGASGVRVCDSRESALDRHSSAS